MKFTLLTLCLLSLALVANAQPKAEVKSEPIKLVWDYPVTGSDLTNYVFNIRSSTNAAAPLPWPILLSIRGDTQVTLQVNLTTNPVFYYCTAVDTRSSPTNYLSESLPSVTVRAALVPSGGLGIQQGP